MTGKCCDIGTIQAFLDGELAFEQSEAVARHVAACDDCAIMLAVAEEESSLAFDALEQEFNTLVPTQRLWTKINDSIEQEKVNKSFWTPIFAFFKQPSIAAFAVLLIIVGFFAVIFNRGTAEDTKNLAVNVQSEKTISVPLRDQDLPQTAQNPPITTGSKRINVSQPRENRNDIRVIQANFVRESNVKSSKKPNTSPIVNPPPVKNVNDTLTGEDSYIKTIATLTESVQSHKDEVLKPSARFAFERDMAVADSAIETMKREVKQNPKDEAAKQILRASYQNKIDLLNSVADKTELMASVK